MKKLAGACLAATMLFSAAPVFAADNSSTAGDVDKSPTLTYPADKAPSASTDAKVDGKDVEIVKENLDEATLKEVDTNEKVLGILADAGYKAPAGATVVVAGAEYDAQVDGKDVTLKEKVEIAFNMAGTEFKAGEPVFVMHKMANGEWEVIASYVNSKGEVVVELNGLSPVVIAKVMSNGEVVKVDYEAPAAGTTTKTSTKTVKKSPNTGF
ncbi:hypothetical protein [Dubosiella muris]|uniref:Uncharacterized protein n=2 Tax=Dubosiella TaxID=1937008 RepID=A0AC61R689_9FIRM|nr:hypothetical protein [Dubosiella muris]TGY65612.1 hypothetical protein E5336_07930 [Dubosiella muris]